MEYFSGDCAPCRRAGAAYSAAVCLFALISAVVAAIISGCGLAGDGAAYLSYICSPLAIAATVSLACALFGERPSYLLPKACGAKYYVAAALCAFGMLFALSPLNTLFIRLVEALGYSPAQSALPSFEGWGMPASLLVIALLPAACEELLFRHVIFGEAQRGAGTWRAVLLSAFVFALYHGSVEQTLYQFACGCVFGLLAARSGSARPSVLAHFINNGAIIVLSGFGALNSEGALAAPAWAVGTITALAALSLAGGLVWLLTRRAPSYPAKKGQVGQFFIWGGAGIAVMAIVWIAGLF